MATEGENLSKFDPWDSTPFALRNVYTGLTNVTINEKYLSLKRVGSLKELKPAAGIRESSISPWCGRKRACKRSSFCSTGFKTEGNKDTCPRKSSVNRNFKQSSGKPKDDILVLNTQQRNTFLKRITTATLCIQFLKGFSKRATIFERRNDGKERGDSNRFQNGTDAGPYERPGSQQQASIHRQQRHQWRQHGWRGGCWREVFAPQKVQAEKVGHSCPVLDPMYTSTSPVSSWLFLF